MTATPPPIPRLRIERPVAPAAAAPVAAPADAETPPPVAAAAAAPSPAMTPVLPAWLLRTPLGALLDKGIRQLRDPRERIRNTIRLGWAGISAGGLALMLLLHLLWASPAIVALAGQSAAGALTVARLLLLIDLLVLACLSAAVYRMLDQLVLKPISQYREHVGNRLAEQGKQKGSELAALSMGHQRRGRHLEAAMADNEILRRQKAQLESRTAWLEHLCHRTYEATANCMIVTDGGGRIVEISPLTIELIGHSRMRALSKSFDEVVQIYEPHHESPLLHPIADLAARVIRSASPVPRIEHVLLASPNGQISDVLLSVTALLDETGAVNGIIFRFDPQTAAAAAAAALPVETVSDTDRATGLQGRSAFDARMRGLIEQARDGGAQHALLLVGVDNRSAIADRLGQQAAEDLLWKVAQIVQAQATAANPCYRATTDFIGIPLAQTDIAQARAMAERICTAVGGEAFVWRDTRYDASASCGLVGIGDDCESVDRLLELASIAAGRARADGGARVAVLDGEDSVANRHRSDKQWIDWLLPRLDDGRIHLVSQSIQPLNPNDTRPRMLEVFVRGEDDDGVWLEPGAFLPAAERFGYSARIDLRVLQATLAELMRLPEILNRHSCVFINISGASLEAPDFANEVFGLITRSTVPGSRLCFEIEESFAISRPAPVAAFMRALRGTGARFSLDHCKLAGGLEALRELPVDFLKLHASLAQRLHAGNVDPMDKLFAGYLSELCRARGVATVATGIETESGLQTLASSAVDYVQGSFLNKFGPVMA